MAEATLVAGVVLVLWGLVGALAILVDVRGPVSDPGASRLARYAALARLPQKEGVSRG